MAFRFKFQLFWIGFLFYLFVGFWLIQLYAKGELELLVNQNHQPLFDFLMKYLTYLGDGIFYSLVIIFLFFRNRTKGITALVCFAVTSLAAQLLKKLVFYDAPRPKAFFGESTVLHFVEGVEVYSAQSFPSGHSTTAFSLFCLLALWNKNQFFGMMCIILAITASFSRVYLLQHFFVDIYFGAILGIVITWVIWKLLDRKTRLNIDEKISNSL